MKSASKKKHAVKKAVTKKVPAKKKAIVKRTPKEDKPQHTKQTAKELEAYAEKLYLSDVPQNEIAKRTGISEKTISKWANDPKKDWEGKKVSLLTSKTKILKNLYATLLRLDKKLQEEDNIGDNKLADAYVKYTASINNLETETSLGQKIETGMRFVEFVESYDLDFAKQIGEAFNSFVLTEKKRS